MHPLRASRQENTGFCRLEAGIFRLEADIFRLETGFCRFESPFSVNREKTLLVVAGDQEGSRHPQNETEAVA